MCAGWSCIGILDLEHHEGLSYHYANRMRGFAMQAYDCTKAL